MRLDSTYEGLKREATVTLRDAIERLDSTSEGLKRGSDSAVPRDERVWTVPMRA